MLLSLNIPMSAILVVVYVVLAPGVVFSLPPKGSIVVKALVHGILFAVASYVMHSYAITSVVNTENFVANPIVSEQALHAEKALIPNTPQLNGPGGIYRGPALNVERPKIMTFISNLFHSGTF
jgi:hypothetical protein